VRSSGRSVAGDEVVVVILLDDVAVGG
jgi:hypothetical protein